MFLRLRPTNAFNVPIAPNVALLVCAAAAAVRGESLEWVRQLGTSTTDFSYGVSADGLGNVYISGSTMGSLGGPNAGFEFDAFVSKYDAAGALQWSRQLGTNVRDLSYGVSADGLGSVYISGTTYGSLGGPTAGGVDAFVSKYDGLGTLQWSRQLGTNATDWSWGVSADGMGNVYISGYTLGNLDGPNAGGLDPFLSKYDAAGTLQWSRQLGTSSYDQSYGVSADGLGNVYISGTTDGSLGGPSAGSADAFVSKYDAAGSLLWTRQLGTSSYDLSYGVSADGLGNVYISGYTDGSSGVPSPDGRVAFVSKYDAAGILQWTRQLGTTDYDVSWGVSADGLGSVYISGATRGSLGGPNAGSTDAFVSKYDAAGNFQWTQQLGTSTSDPSYGVSSDGLGNVYLSGTTYGSLGGPTAGFSDAFVAKIADPVVPEPSTLLFLCLGSLAVLWRRRGLVCALMLAVLVCAATSVQAVTIDMVRVGNPGNSPDLRYNLAQRPEGYGAVDHIYQIGKYEITAGQYTAFLNAVADADPNELYNPLSANPGAFGANIQRTGSSPNYSYTIAADRANRPVNYVSFWDAARFTNWLHNGQPTGPQGPGTTEGGAYHNIGNQALFGRNVGAKFFIPTEDEWYKAAYHDKTAGLAATYFDYPTGTNAEPGNNIYETTNPGNNANYRITNYVLGSPYYRTVWGEFELSDSPYGTFDQAGNVYEWNESVFAGSRRGVRGGSYGGVFGEMHAAYYNPFFDTAPTWEFDHVGFRVASIPEPSTLLLLCCGSLAMLWRRRGIVWGRKGDGGHFGG